MAGSESDPFDGDEDAALRHAIALSLQELGQTADAPVALSSDDDEDDDLEAPLKQHKKHKPRISATPVVAHKQEAVAEFPPQRAVPAALGINGLDRRKMEEERLARLGKRKAPDSAQDTQGGQQKPRYTFPASTASNISSSSSSRSRDLPFPRGTVKKTWVLNQPRCGDDIKIEEVLQKDKLELAVISSFQWEDEWMLSKLDIRKTKLVCVAYAADEAARAEIEANVSHMPNIRFCFPPMWPHGTMHSKLMILKYPEYLRIVVPSGNMVRYDWGETGQMENIVFIIDLPQIEDSHTQEAKEANQLTPFGRDLCYFLRAQGLGEKLVSSLDKFDFSETGSYAFVHSIGTSHEGDEWKKTGYCGLGRAVKSLGLDTAGPVEVDLVVSSLGAVKKDLVSAIYYAAQGDDGKKELEERTLKKPKNSTDSSANSSPWAPFQDRFRIYYPSEETVTQSKAGFAGTICLQTKWWDAETFPRELVHDSKSVRPGVLMHNKMIFVRPLQGSRAWGYIGSHNLSESAWGRLITKNKRNGTYKLTCRNWECGVVIPASKDAYTASEESKAPDLSVFSGIIPVPMEVPGEPYGKTGSKKPWAVATFGR